MYFKNFPNTETLVKDNIVNVKNILRQAVFTNESIEKDDYTNDITKTFKVFKDLK